MTTKESNPRLPACNPESTFGDNVVSREWVDGVERVTLRIEDEFISGGDPEVRDRLRSQAELVDEQLRDQLVYDRKGHLRPRRKLSLEGVVEDNQFSKAIYSLQGMADWYKDTPSARALLPLHDPLMVSLPGRDWEIDETSRNFFLYSLDAQAIRARNKIVSKIASTRLSNSTQPWHISYGSGLAVPVFEAFAQATPQEDIQAFLVDNDVLSHEMAQTYERRLATALGQWDVSTNYITADLINGLIRSDSLVDRCGRNKASVVDVVGVAEYFPSSLAATMLKRSYENVRPGDFATGEPGGVLLWGNMLDEHPQLAFNQCAIQWPDIHPRSFSQLVDIVDAMGVPRDYVTAYTSEDGVYAIFEMRKPELRI